MRVVKCLQRDFAGRIGLGIRHHVPQIMRLAHALDQIRAVLVGDVLGRPVEHVRRQAVALHEARVRVTERAGRQRVQRVEIDRLGIERALLIEQAMTSGVLEEQLDAIGVRARVRVRREDQNLVGLVGIREDARQRAQCAAPTDVSGKRRGVGILRSSHHGRAPLRCTARYCHSDNRNVTAYCQGANSVRKCGCEAA